jgi:hypothetical protein
MLRYLRNARVGSKLPVAKAHQLDRATLKFSRLSKFRAEYLAFRQSEVSILGLCYPKEASSST